MRTSILTFISTLILFTLGLPAASRASTCETCSWESFCSGVELESNTIVEGEVVSFDDPSSSIQIRVEVVHLVGGTSVAAGDVLEARSSTRLMERIEVGSRVVARINGGNDEVLALTDSDRVSCTEEPSSTIPLTVYIAEHQSGDSEQCEDVVRSTPGYQEAPCDAGLFCTAAGGTLQSKLGSLVPLALSCMFLLGWRRLREWSASRLKRGA